MTNDKWKMENPRFYPASDNASTHRMVPMAQHAPASAIRHLVFRSQIAAPSVNVQNSSASTRRTRNPREFIRPSSDSGATGIGRHGKKYRLLVNGAKNATPRPPSVIASKNPWDAVATGKRIASVKNECAGAHPALKKRTAVNKPMTPAKNRECVKPRCPNG